MYITRLISLLVAALSVASAKAAPPASLEPLERRRVPARPFTFKTELREHVGRCTKTLITLLPFQPHNMLMDSNVDETLLFTDTSTGKTAVGTVADECLSCDSESIDLSVGLFEVFAPTSLGVFPVAWQFNAQ
ncbi:hypothetical protein M422DRAFT_267577 [Sphaerobolus stellatus SS14]|uniref:Uncharacterized protein n=1 Tax=Sphaerobolus stellatus (strain SS14) TaxID=990650 RepID=A0A0C9UZT1_SPHS4|nr:hypothetical protein M422DRAFT_267577 [Sphaerobolus stellatus SS14]